MSTSIAVVRNICNLSTGKKKQRNDTCNGLRVPEPLSFVLLRVEGD